MQLVVSCLFNSRTIDTLNPEDSCVSSLILFTETLSILGGGHCQKHDDNVHVGNSCAEGIIKMNKCPWV